MNIPMFGRRSHSAPVLVALAMSLMAFLCPTLLHAQSGTGTITGRILNQGTGQYLRSASVSVVGTNISTVSEDGGAFTLTGVPAGMAKLLVAYTGLDPVEVSVQVGAGQTTTQDVNLTSAVYNDKNVVKLGEFVVATEREGNAKAIQEQREALNFKQVVASDAFGDVSEGNIGEFLKLMPGISIDYNEADARSISIGGMDPKYTTVLFNGSPVASAASSDLSNGRVVELEQLSIAGIETIELNRTPTPEVSGSALAGVVNLRSKGAFDRKGRQLRFQTTLTANSLDMTTGKTPGPDNKDHYKIQPNLFVEYSDVFKDRLGVLASYNYSWAFAEQKAITYTWTFDADPANNATEIPRLNSISLRDSPKPTVRKVYHLQFDYKFRPGFFAQLYFDYNTYSAQFYSRDLGFTFGSAVINAPGSTVPANSNVEYSLNSQTSASGSSVSYNQGGGSTNKHGATSLIGGSISYRRGSFMADITGGFSRSTNWYQDIPFGWAWSVNPGQLTGLSFRWNRIAPNDPNMYITQLSGPDWRNLANLPNGFTITTNDRAGVDEKYTLKGDFRNALRLRETPVQLKYGFSVQESNRYINRRRGNNLTHLGPDHTAATADDAPALYAETDYRMNWPFGGNLNGVVNFDRHKLAQEYGAHPDWFTTINPTTYLQQDLQNRAIVREQLDAAYAQTIFKFGRFDIAPGVRVEHTRGVFNAPASLTDAQTKEKLTGSRTGTVDTQSADYILARYGSIRKDGHADYMTTLKYLHANYRFTRDLLFRASYNESITRPDLNRLAGTITINNDIAIPPVATIGNPDLKPEQGRNIYTSLEYYLPRQASNFSLSWSRRDMKDLIRTTTFDVPVGGSFDGDPTWGGWELRSVDNVAKAHNTSIEFSFRQQLSILPWEFARNFTVWANHTRLYFDSYDNFRRPRKIANAGVDFRYRRFSASWRTNWTGFVRAAVPANGWANYTSEKLFHDMQINYVLWRNYTLTITGRNVLHAPQLTTYAGGREDIMTRYLDIGSIWTFGIKGQF
jgi:TonB-dependent receptor